MYIHVLQEYKNKGIVATDIYTNKIVKRKNKQYIIRQERPKTKQCDSVHQNGRPMCYKMTCQWKTHVLQNDMLVSIMKQYQLDSNL